MFLNNGNLKLTSNILVFNLLFLNFAWSKPAETKQLRVPSAIEAEKSFRKSELELKLTKILKGLDYPQEKIHGIMDSLNGLLKSIEFNKINEALKPITDRKKNDQDGQILEDKDADRNEEEIKVLKENIEKLVENVRKTDSDELIKLLVNSFFDEEKPSESLDRKAPVAQLGYILLKLLNLEVYGVSANGMKGDRFSIRMHLNRDVFLIVDFTLGKTAIGMKEWYDKRQTEESFYLKKDFKLPEKKLSKLNEDLNNDKINVSKLTDQEFINLFFSEIEISKQGLTPAIIAIHDEDSLRNSENKRNTKVLTILSLLALLYYLHDIINFASQHPTFTFFGIPFIISTIMTIFSFKKEDSSIGKKWLKAFDNYYISKILSVLGYGQLAVGKILQNNGFVIFSYPFMGIIFGYFAGTIIDIVAFLRLSESEIREKFNWNLQSKGSLNQNKTMGTISNNHSIFISL